MTVTGENSEHGSEGSDQINKPVGHDTSVSSLSSIENTENDVETGEKLIIKKVTVPQSVASKKNLYDSLSAEAAAAARVAAELEEKSNAFSPVNKKPVTFTVRKVSHETIKSPLHSPTNKQNPVRPKHIKSNPSPEREAEASNSKTDKLKHVQSKYDSCNEKIAKIDKEIEFLEKLLPPYNVEIDYTTRNKITRAIEKLKTKQDEIRKQQYEMGITISRLWREQEGSDIWVKRSERISG
ncbi:hypothetical protein JA1_001410 [Spathaspora sp. JA1]|nr:hypothetical protein JA1_001410 [Spathaspora sp. JA1]